MYPANDAVTITVLVPYLHHNEMLSEIVPFRVYENEGIYFAIPFIPDTQREKMKLPEQLNFQFRNNRIVPSTNQNHDVLYNIVRELQLMQLV